MSHPTFEEDPTQASIEFQELVVDFQRIERAEKIFSAIFIDKKPFWRKQHYQLVLNGLKNALKDKAEAFLQTDPGNQISPLLHFILAPTKKSAQKNYLYFISLFRKLLKVYSESNMLQTIALAFFKEIYLSSFCMELTSQMIKAGEVQLKLLNKSEYDQNARFFRWDFFLYKTKVTKQSNSDLSHFTLSLMHARASIEHAPHALRIPLLSMLWQFAKGQLNFHYDPYRQSNTPYHLFQYTPKDIPAIRMGTPTYEGFLAPLTKKASIIPEFIAFIEGYKAQNKRHLYINLQNRNRAKMGRDESSKCRVIEELSLHYPETIVVITLAKNTAFYHQEEPFEYLEDASIFKECFQEELYSPHGGFYFSKESGVTKEITLSLLNGVHTTYFQERESLSLEERLDFIELFYLELTKQLIKQLLIDSFNLSCKDGIDRAGCANALLYLDSDPSHDFTKLQSILFAPALIVKKRAVTQGRFDRFLTASLRLITSKKDFL